MSPFLPLTPALIDQLAREGYRWHVLHWRGETNFWLTHFRDYKEAYYAYQGTRGQYRFIFDLKVREHRAKLERPKNGIILWSERIDLDAAIAICEHYDPIMRKWFKNHCYYQLRDDEPLRKELIMFQNDLYILAGEPGWMKRFKLKDLDVTDQGGLWSV